MSTNINHSDTFITLTFENDVRVLQKAIDLHNILVGKLSSVSGDWTMQNMFQPIPTVFAKHSVENGGNVLGLDRFSENLVRKYPISLPTLKTTPNMTKPG